LRRLPPSGTPWPSRGFHLEGFGPCFALPGDGCWHSGLCLAMFRCPSYFADPLGSLLDSIVVAFWSFFAVPGLGFGPSGVCWAMSRCPSDFLPLSLLLGPPWLEPSSMISAFALPRPLQLRPCLPWFRHMALLHLPLRRSLVAMSKRLTLFQLAFWSRLSSL
jgi:hypothetical protein